MIVGEVVSPTGPQEIGFCTASLWKMMYRSLSISGDHRVELPDLFGILHYPGGGKTLGFPFFYKPQHMFLSRLNDRYNSAMP
jgi:hypothetical protein